MGFKYKSEASSGFGTTARVVAKSKNIYTAHVYVIEHLNQPLANACIAAV